MDEDLLFNTAQLAGGALTGAAASTLGGPAAGALVGSFGGLVSHDLAKSAYTAVEDIVHGGVIDGVTGLVDTFNPTDEAIEKVVDILGIPGVDKALDFIDEIPLLGSLI